MKTKITAVLAGILMVLVTMFGATSAQAMPVEPAAVPASHSGSICNNHSWWYPQAVNWGRACWRDWSSDASYGYGQNQDLLSDGDCTVVQTNRNDGTGWRNIYNSVSCYPDSVSPWYGYYLNPSSREALWVRFVRGNASTPGAIVTIRNCYTGYRCPQPYTG